MKKVFVSLDDVSSEMIFEIVFDLLGGDVEDFDLSFN